MIITIMSDLDLRRLIWEKRKSSSFGVACLCSECGGGSSSFCECAYRKFQPSQEEIDEMKAKLKAKDKSIEGKDGRNDKEEWQSMYESERKQMWDHLSRTGYHNKVPCLRCEEPSTSFCKCAYEQFRPSFEELFRFQHKEAFPMKSA
jgi:hypothetical protein